MGLDSVSGRDVEFQDLERHDLLTGEPRYIEDEVRNTSFAKIFGILAFITLLVAMILTWILYFRDRNSTFLWHGIWLIGLMVFAIICIAWAFMATPAVRAGRQPMPILSTIVYLGSLLALGYLVVEALWLVFYKPLHYDYLVGLRTDTGIWNNRMVSGSSFEDGWVSSRRMIWWTIFMGLIAAICFAYLIYASRSVVWNRYQLTRWGLYWALAWIVLAAWLVLYWTRKTDGYRELLNSSAATNTMLILRAIAIIALVFAVINAIVNLLKIRIGYFIMGMVAAALILATAATTGLLWREIRNKQYSEQQIYGMSNCQSTLASIHENDLGDFCSGGKYLAAGQTCGKAFLTTRWEGNNEVRSLNPQCCLSAKYFYLWPYMMLGYWALVMLFGLIVAMCCNFYLGDTTDYLTNANKSIGLGDILGLLLLLILFIIFGIYFLARKYNWFGMRPSRQESFASFQNPTFYNSIDNFDKVPRAVIQENYPFNANQIPTNSTCYPYNTTALYYPTFSTANSVCNNPATCSMRLAIGVTGGTLNIPTDGGARRPTTDNRYSFIPDCNGLTDYAMFYGTQDQLRTVLNNLRICPSYFSSTPQLLIYSDQVNSSNIGTNGLVPGDSTATSAANPANCGAGFNINSCYPTGTTSGNVCKFRSDFQNQYYARTVKGRFYYMKNNQKFYDVPNTLQIALFDGGRRVGTNETILADGSFFIDGVPRYRNATWTPTLQVTDSANQFLEKRVDIIYDAGVDEDLSIGEIRLDTRDGSICTFTDATCINNQQLKRGNINVPINNGGYLNSSVYPVSDVTVTATYQHTFTENPVQNATTNANGYATLTNLPYGPYTIVTGKTGFRPSVQLVDLQEPNLNLKPTYIYENTYSEDARVTADYGTNVGDYDLVLQMRSDRGSFCEVSPLNKYCPWTASINDVIAGPGEENIIIRRLSVATYNAFVRPAPAYSNNCPAGQVIDQYAYHFEALKWSHQQGSTTTKIIPGLIRTRTLFNPFWNFFINRAYGIFMMYPRPFRYETANECGVPRLVIVRGNAPVPRGALYYLTTCFVGGGALPVPPSGNGSLPFQPNTTTPACPCNGTNCSCFTGYNCSCNGTNNTNCSCFTNGSNCTNNVTVVPNNYTCNSSVNCSCQFTGYNCSCNGTTCTCIYQSVNCTCPSLNCTTVTGPQGEISTICTNITKVNDTTTNNRTTNDTKFVNGNISNATSDCNTTITPDVNTTICNGFENSTLGNFITNKSYYTRSDNFTNGTKTNSSQVSLNASDPTFNSTFAYSDGARSDNGTLANKTLFGTNYTNYSNGSNTSNVQNYTYLKLPNGTNQTLTDNSTALTANSTALPAFYNRNATLENIYPNATNETFTNITNSTYYPANFSNVTVQNNSWTVNGTQNFNNVTLAHNKQIKTPAHLQAAYQNSFYIPLGSFVRVFDLITLTMVDLTRTNDSVTRMNNKQGWRNIGDLTIPFLQSLTLENIWVNKIRNKTIQVLGPQNMTMNTSVLNDSNITFAPTNASESYTRWNITVNQTNSTNGANRTTENVTNNTNLTSPIANTTNYTNTTNFTNATSGNLVDPLGNSSNWSTNLTNLTIRAFNNTTATAINTNTSNFSNCSNITTGSNTSTFFTNSTNCSANSSVLTFFPNGSNVTAVNSSNQTVFVNINNFTWSLYNASYYNFSNSSDVDPLISVNITQTMYLQAPNGSNVTNTTEYNYTDAYNLNNITNGTENYTLNQSNGTSAGNASTLNVSNYSYFINNDNNGTFIYNSSNITRRNETYNNSVLAFVSTDNSTEYYYLVEPNGTNQTNITWQNTSRIASYNNTNETTYNFRFVSMSGINSTNTTMTNMTTTNFTQSNSSLYNTSYLILINGSNITMNNSIFSTAINYTNTSFNLMNNNTIATNITVSNNTCLYNTSNLTAFNCSNNTNVTQTNKVWANDSSNKPVGNDSYFFNFTVVNTTNNGTNRISTQSNVTNLTGVALNNTHQSINISNITNFTLINQTAPVLNNSLNFSQNVTHNTSNNISVYLNYSNSTVNVTDTLTYENISNKTCEGNTFNFILPNCSNITNNTVWNRSLNGTFVYENYVQNFSDKRNNTNGTSSNRTHDANISNSTNTTAPNFVYLNSTFNICSPINTTQANCTYLSINNLTYLSTELALVGTNNTNGTYNNLTADRTDGQVYAYSRLFRSNATGTLVNLEYNLTLNNSNLTKLLNTSSIIDYNSTQTNSSTTIFLGRNTTNTTMDNYYRLDSGNASNTTFYVFKRNYSSVLTQPQTTVTSPVPNIPTSKTEFFIDNTTNADGTVNNLSLYTTGTVNSIPSTTANDVNYTERAKTFTVLATAPAGQKNETSFNYSNVIVNGTAPVVAQSGAYRSNVSKETYTFNWTTATPDSQTNATRSCSQVNESSVIAYHNGSNVTAFVFTSNCILTNGSTTTNRTNATYVTVLSPSPATVTNYSQTVYTVTTNGVTTTYTNSTTNGARRRMLMQVDEAHLQGTAATTGPTTGTQVFSGVTVNNVPAGNWVWVSCFTGFGYPSLVEINTIVDREPTIDDCITVLRNNRPNYTVDKLRSYVENWKRNNPNASYD